MSKAACLRDLPGPHPLPIIGNAFQIAPSRLHLDLEAWADRYGPCYRFHIGRKPFVVLAESGLILEVLRDRPDGFRRLSAIEAVNSELGVRGVFSAEGDRWRLQRQLVMQGFDRTQLQAFFPKMLMIAQRLLNRWEAAADARTPFDAKADLTRYTVDVTTNFVFGYDMNTLERGEDELQSHLEKILPMINRRVNALFPYWRYWKLPADRELDQAVAALKQLCGRMITAIENHPTTSAEQPVNLLQALVAARDEGDSFSMDDLISNAITMLLAGEDTSAHTLAWAIHYLCCNPSTQQRMQSEVDTMTSLSAIEDLERLTFVDAVLLETMRLKSVAPLLFLEANHDITVGGLRIPRGTGVMTLLRHVCLQDSQFSRAKEFAPERWCQPRDSERYPVHNKQALIPFGAGPRFCPGRQLAWFEMKIALAAMCRRYQLELAPGAATPTERFGFTMTPSHLRIRLMRR